MVASLALEGYRLSSLSAAKWVKLWFVNNQKITTVCFDMGGTLLDYHPLDGGGWQGMERLGAEGFYNSLTTQGYHLPTYEDVMAHWWEAMRGAWEGIEHLPKTRLRLRYQLEQLLDKWALSVSEPHFIEAERACAVKFQQSVRPLEGALESVKWAREQGLKTGLLSNTLWAGEYHIQDLNRFGYEGLFDILLFSSDALAWKPQPDIFMQAAQALGAEAAQCVYVGDNIFFDIYGAQSAGWRTVWVQQPAPWMPEGLDIPTPDAQLTTLSELPAILEGWL